MTGAVAINGNGACTANVPGSRLITVEELLVALPNCKIPGRAADGEFVSIFYVNLNCYFTVTAS